MNKELIVKLAAEAAVTAAMNYIENQRKKQITSRHDKRLRNTRLLLKHYNFFKVHCQNSVYNLQQAENAIDVLDSLDECDSDVYIQSIKRSVTRTHIILSHIDEMLNLYQIYCQRSERLEDKRRYRILCAFYFDELRVSEVAEMENIDERTCYRDVREAVEKLSALIFGIDGLSQMSKMCQ